MIMKGFVLNDNQAFYLSRFVEYGEFRGHLYGTSVDSIKEVIARGKVCVLAPHTQVMLKCGNALCLLKKCARVWRSWSGGWEVYLHLIILFAFSSIDIYLLSFSEVPKNA
jgi:hypothetical protein